jgi:hypothetical protein
LAQLDDYTALRRGAFLWEPSGKITLRARVSAEKVPGTWGFGLWNDPFAMGVLTGLKGLRFPALPRAAWFFYASEDSYLSLRDDLPANGWMGMVIQSPDWSPVALALGLPVLPLLVLPPAVRALRGLARHIILQETAAICVDPTAWHAYELVWSEAGVCMKVDGEAVLDSGLSPGGPLGLVIWIDNQYAATHPSGFLRYGTLASPEPLYLEIGDVNAIQD